MNDELSCGAAGCVFTTPTEVAVMLFTATPGTAGCVRNDATVETGCIQHSTQNYKHNVHTCNDTCRHIHHSKKNYT